MQLVRIFLGKIQYGSIEWGKWWPSYMTLVNMFFCSLLQQAITSWELGPSKILTLVWSVTTSIGFVVVWSCSWRCLCCWMGPFNWINLQSWSSFGFLILGVRGVSGCFKFPHISWHVIPIAAASLPCYDGETAICLCACCWTQSSLASWVSAALQ